MTLRRIAKRFLVLSCTFCISFMTISLTALADNNSWVQGTEEYESLYNNGITVSGSGAVIDFFESIGFTVDVTSGYLTNMARFSALFSIGNGGFGEANIDESAIRNAMESYGITADDVAYYLKTVCASSDDDVGWVEEAISSLIKNLGLGFEGLFANRDYSLSLENIVYGRLSSTNKIGVNIAGFELVKNNPYGIVGAYLYAILRSVMYTMFFVYFLWMIVGQVFSLSGAKGRAEFKQRCMTLLFLFFYMYVFPYLVDLVIYLKDILITVIAEPFQSMKLFGSTITNTFMGNYVAKPSLLNAFMYLVSVCSVIPMFFSYVKYAIMQLLLFGFGPSFILAGVKDKKLFSNWNITFFTNIFVPLFDSLLILLPAVLSRIYRYLKGVGLGTSSGLGTIFAVIELICVFSVVPTRNFLLRLFGNMTGTAVGNGFSGMGAMALMAMRMGRSSMGGRSAASSRGGNAATLDADISAGNVAEHMQKVGEINGAGFRNLADIENTSDSLSSDAFMKPSDDKTGMIGEYTDQNNFSMGDDLSGVAGMPQTPEADNIEWQNAGVPYDDMDGVSETVDLKDMDVQNISDSDINGPAMEEMIPENMNVDPAVDVTSREIPKENATGAYDNSTDIYEGGTTVDPGVRSMADLNDPIAGGMETGGHETEKPFRYYEDDGMNQLAMQRAQNLSDMDQNNLTLSKEQAEYDRMMKEYNEHSAAERDIQHTLDRSEKSAQAIANDEYARIWLDEKSGAVNLPQERVNELKRNILSDEQIAAHKKNILPEDKRRELYQRQEQENDYLTNPSVNRRINDQKRRVTDAKEAVSRNQQVEKAFAERYKQVGMSGNTYSSGASFERQMRIDANKKTLANYKNFDTKQFSDILSPQEKESYYRRREAHNARMHALETAGRIVKGTASVGGALVGAASMAYTGEQAAVQGAMFGAVAPGMAYNAARGVNYIKGRRNIPKMNRNMPNPADSPERINHASVQSTSEVKEKVNHSAQNHRVEDRKVPVTQEKPQENVRTVNARNVKRAQETDFSYLLNGEDNGEN